MTAKRMFEPKLQLCFILSITASWVFLGASQLAEGLTIPVDAVQGAGFVDVDAGLLPQILGAPIGVVQEIDFVLNNETHIELFVGASTDIEFGIGNTGNNVELPYRIVFDLSDELGNLITQDALVVESTAPPNNFHIVNLDLTPLPAVTFHDFHVRVETQGDSGLFSIFVAGGAGGTGAVSGPVTFNRAEVGDWIIPEPSGITLLWFGMFGLHACTRRSRA